MTAVWFLFACGGGPRYADETRRFAAPASDGTRTYPTVVHEPTAYGVLDTPIADPATGTDLPAGTACVACHDSPSPAGEPRFHTTVETHHGTLSCDQCHDDDRSQLHLADDTPVAFVDVLTLCGQCHGPQLRDFSHGAHGGGSGYWDTTRGTKLKNNCVDCHDPHAPVFPTVRPVLPPHDRNPLRSH